jgi:hypothetical protein
MPPVQDPDAPDSVPDAKRDAPAAGWTVCFSNCQNIKTPTAHWQQSHPSEPGYDGRA